MKMKYYSLQAGKLFNLGECTVEEAKKETRKLIDDTCSRWQVRNLAQTGNSNYDDDGIDSEKIYEPLDPDEFVITDGKIVGYNANHFDVCRLVKFDGTEEVRLGDYDFSDYSGGSGRVDRGHVKIVHRPDLDSNPYYDEPRFHSQEEYDDYIKWRD